jgi:hypothetical protein
MTGVGGQRVKKLEARRPKKERFDRKFCGIQLETALFVETKSVLLRPALSKSLQYCNLLDTAEMPVPLRHYHAN